jgi:putative tributyrin esterase
MAKLISIDLPTANWPSSVPVRAIVPDGVGKRRDGSGAVLFLLHGLFGSCDNWIEHTSLVDLLDGREYTVVAPEAWDSWYIDSASDRNESYEQFFFNDLVRWADEEFGPSPDRGIAGLSMGGFGAFVLGLKRPDLFRFAYSTSGAFVGPGLTRESNGFDELKDSAVKAFGLANSPQRREYDVFNLVRSLDAETTPEFIFDCGTEDSLLEINRSLSGVFAEKKIRFSFHEYAGGHDWDYWSARLTDILDAADRFLTN